jgi:hypothetical protein
MLGVSSWPDRHGADARRREEAPEPRAARTGPLRERPLGDELDLPSADRVGQRCNAVGIAGKRGDELLHLIPLAENLRRQRAEAGRITGQREVADAAIAKRQE